MVDVAWVGFTGVYCRDSDSTDRVVLPLLPVLPGRAVGLHHGRQHTSTRLRPQSLTRSHRLDTQTDSASPRPSSNNNKLVQRKYDGRAGTEHVTVLALSAWRVSVAGQMRGPA